MAVTTGNECFCYSPMKVWLRIRSPLYLSIVLQVVDADEVGKSDKIRRCQNQCRDNYQIRLAEVDVEQAISPLCFVP